MNQKKYYPTALALYMTYFILGIAVTIMSQYKQNFAAMWGANQLADGTFDVSTVMAVIAATGLGRLIAFPVAGPFSDKCGRKQSALVGVVLFAIFFIGITFAPNIYVAYILMICSGMANSFLDTSVTPSCMEIFKENGAIANLFTKFAISVSQFLLPFMITFVAAQNMSFRTLYFVAAAIIIIDGILIAILPFPPKEEVAVAATGEPVKAPKIKFTPSTIALICIGFTATTTFQLYLNCNQELGALYGLANPSMIQSFYSVGIVCAVFFTSFLMKKGLKPIRVLIIYPSIALVMLLVMYFVRIPQICLIGGFVIGYSAAGGVLQLATSTANEMFPANKGKITSIVMIASSLANYIVLNIAGVLSRIGGENGPGYILLFNVAVTAVGILLAVILNLRFEKDAQGIDTKEESKPKKRGTVCSEKSPV